MNKGSESRISFKTFRPYLVPALQWALRNGYQLAIEDIGFTDVCYQEPCNSGHYPHSRWNSEIDISGRLTRNIQLKLPIISSSMPGVTSYEVATRLGEAGGLAVLPRESSLEELRLIILQLRTWGQQNNMNAPWYAGAVGVYPRTGPSALKRVELMVEWGIPVLFVDTQQANSALVISFCKELKKQYPKLPIILGVYNSIDGIKRAIDAGADGVRVGIGTGDACLTSVMSGVTKGQVNTVIEIANYMDTHPDQAVPIVVDGGTSTPGGAAIMMTFLKGHGAIMLGTKIAATFESSSEKKQYKTDEGVVTKAIIEGMGSPSIDAKRGRAPHQRISEGTVITKPVVESIRDLLLRYEGGFRTAMYGYHGAKNWVELADRAIIGLNSPSNIVARLYKTI